MHNKQIPDKPLSIIQYKGQRWNIYHGSNGQEIANMEAVMRPKLAELHYGKSKLNLFFGNANGNARAAQGKDRVSNKWQVAENRIQKFLQSQNKLKVERTTSGYSLAVREINSLDDVDLLTQIIVLIQDAYLTKNNSNSFQN